MRALASRGCRRRPVILPTRTGPSSGSTRSCLPATDDIPSPTRAAPGARRGGRVPALPGLCRPAPPRRSPAGLPPQPQLRHRPSRICQPHRRPSGARYGRHRAMVAARGGFPQPGSLPAARRGPAGTRRPARSGRPGLVVDLAGGTGHYLAGVLDALPHRNGACLDLSVPALRRAARAHPRAAALGADVWRPLPLADRSAALALGIFGPRNAAETGRILGPERDADHSHAGHRPPAGTPAAARHDRHRPAQAPAARPGLP